MTTTPVLPSRSFASMLARSSVFALLLLGCPSDDPTPIDDTSSSGEPMTSGPNACIPGQQATCSCEDGTDGVQVCLPDGSGFGSCECEPDPLDGTTSTSSGTTAAESSDSGTTAADTGTTGGTTGGTDTGTTASESSGEESTTGEPSVCEMYTSPPGVECDQWLQDCPAGEKCMPWANDGGSSWNSVRCSPLDAAPDQLGDPCTVQGSGVSGIDSCDIGLMCWGVDPTTNTGTCIELCNGCPDEAYCDTAGEVCVNTNGGFLTICLPGCDPVLQDCGAGQGCYPVADTFLCAPDASGGTGFYGDPCEFINVCQPGLVCLEPTAVPACFGSGCCTEICDVTNPAGDAQCTGAPSGQTCQAWYAAGTAPAGYEDVGVCSL